MTLDDVIAHLAADPEGSGLVCDLDGTLAPIVDDPEAVRLPEPVRVSLEGASRHLGLVAIVSGRPAAFLAERAAAEGVRLLGLYGMEEVGADGLVRARPEVADWEGVLDRARGALAEAVAADADLRLEDKGLSLAVHWRGAPDVGAAGERADALARAVAERTGLAREPGKLVEELRPPIGWDKGAVVALLAEEVGLRSVTYLGDDRGDLPGLREARARGGVAVVVDHGAETPAEVRAAADCVLHGEHDAHRLVARLADTLAERG